MPCIRVCKNSLTKPPYCVPPPAPSTFMEGAREWWEEFDLRILVLYILFAQLYLHFFGRLRRRSKSVWLVIVNVWLLYLFSELLATIALGKLSKLNKIDDYNRALRGMWAPLILIYLGGPDTITVLRVEENQLWVRHLIGLFTLGLRAAYALIVTWDRKNYKLSLLALLLFIPGIIKYGERAWVVKVRSKNDARFVQLNLPSIDKISASQRNAKLVLLAYSWFHTLRPHRNDRKCKESELEPLVKNFHGSVSKDTDDAFQLTAIELGLIYDMLFSKVGTIFTVLGSILRFLSFSLIVSALVIYIKCVRRGLGSHDSNTNIDDIFTIILLAGAIFLEIAGIFVQLVSDWALVWAMAWAYRDQSKQHGPMAYKDQSKRATQVLITYEFLISKLRSKRWSGVIGQFSLGKFYENYKGTVCSKMREFYKNYKGTVCSKTGECNKTGESHFVREKMLKTFFSSQEILDLRRSSFSRKSPVQLAVDLIMVHLSEKCKVVQTSDANVDSTQTSTQTSTQKIVGVDISQTFTQKITINVGYAHTSTDKIVAEDTVPRRTTEKGTDVKFLTPAVERGEWTLKKYDLVREFKRSIDPEFGQSIVIWHVATEVCYESDHDPKSSGEDKVKMTAVKILSDYMMYLLVACHSRFPFCFEYDRIMQDYDNWKGRFIDGESKEVENVGDNPDIRLVDKGHELGQQMKRKEKRWDIMGSMWAEMLCYAAWECEVENHIQELRHGGEFLTHVWLLLMHFGIPKKVEKKNFSLKDELDGGTKTTGGTFNDLLS